MIYIKRYKYQITLCLFLLLVIGGIFVKERLNRDKYEDMDIVVENDISLDKEDSDKDLKDNAEECVVDIKGAVVNPSVYQISCNANVYDVIKLAGGLRDDADTSFTNLAKKVFQEMVIIIYTQDEVKNSNVVDTVVKVVEGECVCPNIKNDSCINDEINDTIGGNSDSNLININTASISEIMKIPGIGESKAKAIIEYREKNGNFSKIEDIQNVGGIGSKLYEEIKIYITT